MRVLVKITLYSMLLCILMGLTFALPTGPKDITGNTEYRLDSYAPITVNATAGNITEMNINAWSVTRTWQGYFGNVTGTIVLADQNNATLYDWSNTNPNGRVYATIHSGAIDWPGIACATKNVLDVKEAEFTLTNETDRNGNYPIDSVNNTFVNSTDYTRTDGTSPRTVQWANYSTFWVGPVQINGTGLAGECFTAVLHNSTAVDQSNQSAGNDQNHWREILLADAAGTGNVVYTAILEQNYVGFDSKPHDFQMIVGENGHGTDVTATPYYFYVELE